MKEKYGDRIRLLFTDADFLCYHVKTDDFNKDISQDIRTKYDTSNFPKNHPSRFPTGSHRTYEGRDRGERNSWILGITCDVIRHPHMDDGDDLKRFKDVIKSVVRMKFTLEDYENYVLGGILMNVNMNVIRSRAHELFTETRALIYRAAQYADVALIDV